MRIVFLGSGCLRDPVASRRSSTPATRCRPSSPSRTARRGAAASSRPPPMKPVAEARGVPVLQPRRVREPEAQESLRALAPELQVVVAFGQILPRSVIEIAAAADRQRPRLAPAAPARGGPDPVGDRRAATSRPASPPC